jgi:Tfp pilus assembly protein PilN
VSLWRPEAALELRIGPRDWRLTRAGIVVARADFDSLDGMVQSFSSASLTAQPGGTKRLAVVVHEQWVRSFTVHPPAGLRGLRELRALARARLEQLYGIDSSSWTVRAEWSGTRRFVVTAMPLAMIDALKAFCGRMSLQLAAIVPMWVHALASRGLSRRPQWWGITQEDQLTVVHTHDGRLSYARSVRLAAEAREEDICEIAQRECMRSDVATDAGVSALQRIDARAGTTTLSRARKALCAEHDAARNGHPFAPPRLHRAWPTLAVAASLIALATTGAWKMSALNGERSGLERELAAARAAMPVATPAQHESRPPPRREVDAFNAVAHRLNTPWPDIFASLEQTMPANVALLGIDPDTGQSRMRGSAQAVDHRAMVDYVGRLSSRWPFGQARLLRHEMNEKDSARPLRFQFELSLQSSEVPR